MSAFAGCSPIWWPSMASAAAIAGVGAGLYNDFSIVEGLIQSDDAKEPNAQEHDKYQKLLPVFKKFYESLIPAYREFGNIK